MPEARADGKHALFMHATLLLRIVMHDLLPSDVESACKSFTNNDRRVIRSEGSEIPSLERLFSHAGRKNKAETGRSWTGLLLISLMSCTIDRDTNQSSLFPLVAGESWSHFVVLAIIAFGFLTAKRWNSRGL